MEVQATKAVVKKCLEQLIENSGQEIQDDTDLLEAGLDSMNFIRLVVSLEEELNFEIADEDIMLSHFQNLDCICNLLEKYQS